MILPETILFKNSNYRHLIGLGTASRNLITKYGSEMNFDSLTIIDSSVPKSSGEVAKYSWFSPFDTVVNPFSYLRFEKNAPLPIIPIPVKIKDHLRQLEGELIFYSGLGNVTGTILTQSLALFTSHLPQNLKWVATMPFKFEGENKNAWAVRAISILKENSQTPHCFYFEDIRSKYGDLSILSAFEKGDNEILRLIDFDSTSTS